MFAYVRKITYLSVANPPPINVRHMAKHRLTTRKPWTYDSKVMDFDFNLFYFTLFLLFY